MSLINEMLKDLGKRTEKKPVATTYVYPKKASAKTFFRLSLHYLLQYTTIILCLVLLMVAVFVSIKMHKNNVTTFKPATVATKQPINIQNKPETYVQQKTTITGITLQIKEGVTELSFLLNHTLYYELNDHSARNEMTLVLYGTMLTSALPPLQNIHSALQRITTETKNGNTFIKIQLMPNSKLKYLTLTDDKSNPELVLAFTGPENVSEKQTTPSSVLKKTHAETLYSETYQTALNLLAEGAQSEAIKKLYSVLQINPQFHQARTTLAALLIEQGQKQAARQVLATGLNLNADYLPFLELKARLLISENKLTQAIALLARVSPSMEEHAEYYGLIAALYQRNHQDHLAINIYQQLLTLFPENSRWWLGLAISMENIQKTSQAVEAYKQALSQGQLTPELVAFAHQHIQTLQEVIHAG